MRDHQPWSGALARAVRARHRALNLTVEREVVLVPVEVRHRTTAPHGRESLIGGPARQRERGARQEVPPSTRTRAGHALFRLVLLVALQSPREALEPHCRLKLLGRYPPGRNARKRHLCARRTPHGKPTASMTCSATVRPKRASHAFGIGSALTVVPVATGLVILSRNAIQQFDEPELGRVPS